MMQNKTVGYMCKTEFDYELGAASDGAKVYPSINSLKKHRKCTDECGIVKVEVSLLEIIQDENWPLNIE